MGGSGSLHQAQAFLHCSVDERLEQAAFTFKVVIENRLGDARRFDDVLHCGAGITAVGKQAERRVEQALTGVDIGHGAEDASSQYRVNH
jgi:hypothetical protein